MISSRIRPDSSKNYTADVFNDRDEMINAVLGRPS